MRHWLWVPLSLLAFPATAAPILNGSFETGDLTGWNITVDLSFMTVGDEPVDFEELPFDFFDGFPSFKPQVFEHHFYDPVDGGYYAELQGTIGSSNDFEGYLTDGAGTITLTQEVTLQAGDLITGATALFTRDYPPYDTDRAFVTVSGAHGTDEIIKVSVRDAFGETWLTASDGPAQSAWVPWSWRAPLSGTYTLTLGNRMDDQEDSYAAFDDIRVQSVPEPSTLWLLTVACLAARCHRPKKGASASQP